MKTQTNIKQLKEKYLKLCVQRECFKRFNKVWKSSKSIQAASDCMLAEVRITAESLGYADDQYDARALMNNVMYEITASLKAFPHYAEQFKIPTFLLTNLSPNIKRVAAQLEIMNNCLDKEVWIDNNTAKVVVEGDRINVYLNKQLTQDVFWSFRFAPISLLWSHKTNCFTRKVSSACYNESYKKLLVDFVMKLDESVEVKNELALK